MADLRTAGYIEYKRGTHMKKWDWDNENQVTGGRAIHLVRDVSTAAARLLASDTDLDLTNATIFVKNLSATNHVRIGLENQWVIKVLPYRHALWQNQSTSALTFAQAVGGTVKLEIIVVEA